MSPHLLLTGKGNQADQKTVAADIPVLQSAPFAAILLKGKYQYRERRRIRHFSTNNNETMSRGGKMKVTTILLCSILILMAASALQAGGAVLYAGFQKPGVLDFDSATEIPGDMLEGGYGGTFGVRFSGGRVIGFEQNISFSPRFARSGVRAFQMDTNLILQAPGKVTPYATAGIGFITTWGQPLPDDLDPAKIASFAFSMGKEFSINYGGGLKIRKILGPMGFNADVRGYTIPSAREGSLSFIQMSVGPVFTW
jgi:hypothetical protein